MKRREAARAYARAGVVTAAAAAAWLRWPRHQMRAGSPRILLVRPDHLGDVLLTTPAIAALRAALPQARLIALVGPWAAPALARNPHLDAVHVTPFPGFTREAAPALWAPYAQLLRQARRLARWRVDAAINFRPDFWWGAALLALAGIPVRVGYNLAPGATALTHRVSLPPAPEHAARLALRLAATASRAMGAPGFAPAPWQPEAHPVIFPLDDADRAWAREWLERAGLPGAARPLLVHPGAGAPVKRWTATAWARVIERLAAELDAPVVVAGAAAEAGVAAAITQAVRAPAYVLSFAEDAPLTRYAALLASARLVLGVDSGPLHLAAAVGTPTVRLFGPTDPAVFGPWGPAGRHAVVRSAALPCMPCGRLDYPDAELPAHPCVRLIHPNLVVNAARTLLGQEDAAESSDTRESGAISATGSGAL